ncbi:hypothetical protein I4U23_022782 [Adineta vaga]|nr:hypothetical protein I4U23_022782 [Adineta vaga]
MNLKILYEWLYKKAYNYNLFILEENDYEDNDDNIQDAAIILEQQKYKTWLYVVLLTVCLYVLFYGTLIKTESKTVVISNITPDIFDQLYAEHGQALTCPCSTITIPYINFVSNNVTMHPVCSSVFVTKEWIEGLYVANASYYESWDFRKTAYSQVSLHEVSTPDNTIESQKNNGLSRMTLFFNYWKTTIARSNTFSALALNTLMAIAYTDYVPTVFGFPGTYIRPSYFVVVPCGISSVDGNAVNPTYLITPPRDLKESAMQWVAQLPSNAIIVKGFFATCTVLNALLASTLDCLYDLECIQLLFNYFPNLNQVRTVLRYALYVFILSFRATSIGIIPFYHPSMVMTLTALAYAITLFISLYGGLIIILRLVASYLITIWFKRKRYSNNANESSRHQNTNIRKSICSITHLNLFKNINDRSENSIKQQKLTTRIYLVLLLGSISALCLSSSLRTEVVTIIIPNPLLTTYNSLEMKYSTTLRCPCANKTISYGRITSFSPIFHQICLSGFIQDTWIKEMIESTYKASKSYDWRLKAYKEFQILSDFCHLANKTINAAIDRFLSQFFVASSVMNKINFEKQLDANINQVYQSIVYNFNLMKDIIQLIQQVNQFHDQMFSTGTAIYDSALAINVVENKTDDFPIIELEFVLHGIQDINSGLTTCVCATNPKCQGFAVVFNDDDSYDLNDTSDRNHNISGWIDGCLASNSLLLSTLQCLYADSDSDCFAFLLSNLWKTTNSALNSPLSPARIQPLVYDPTVSRYLPNTTISTIVEELMLEQWNTVSSYQRFYESCAPTYCSYSESIRKQTPLGLIITFVSMIGGIVVSLRILTPQLVKFFFGFRKNFNRKSNQTEGVQHNDGTNLKTKIQNIIKLLRTALVDLNIFILRDFGSNVDRVTAKRYGQWATRLYIILFLTSITILISYTITQPYTLTKKFDQPSFNYYNQLREIYGVELKCPCSRIASSYNQFVSIQPVFHSICLSKFISNEWRVGLINGLVPNLTVYEQSDYRRFLSAHLQYLQGLCQLSIQTVNNSINEFLTSLLVTVELLDENSFHNRLDTLIKRSESSAPVLFSQFISLSRSIIDGNVFVTTYGTNFEYVIMMDGTNTNFAPAEPIVYNNNCSCGFSPTCTTQATSIEPNPLSISSVKGMKMGCTPCESLLASTLECFYDQSCLDLIQQYTNYENSSTPLSTISSRFSQNITIDVLKENLFIEEWSTHMNYSSYYGQCLPLLCSYTSIEKYNTLNTITVILGLQGGLTIVLKWICPKLVRIGSKIYYRRKNRVTSVHPIVSIEIPCSVTTNTIIQHTTWNNAILPMNGTFQ